MTRRFLASLCVTAMGFVLALGAAEPAKTDVKKTDADRQRVLEVVSANAFGDSCSARMDGAPGWLWPLPAPEVPGPGGDGGVFGLPPGGAGPSGI